MNQPVWYLGGEVEKYTHTPVDRWSVAPSTLAGNLKAQSTYPTNLTFGNVQAYVPHTSSTTTLYDIMNHDKR